MLQELLTPTNEEVLLVALNSASGCLGQRVKYHHNEIPDLENVDLAIVGVIEDRGNPINEGCGVGSDYVRPHLYHLFAPQGGVKLADLGNIKIGESVADTRAALSTIVNELLSSGVVPIILGGSHDLTYGQFTGYSNFKKGVNMVVVDERIDLAEFEDQIDCNSFMLKIILEQKAHLFNFAQIGYQKYLTDPQSVETLTKLKFDTHRLGFCQNNIDQLEPIIRDADLLSFDLSAIRWSDFTAHSEPTPHGFYGEQACQIMRYAGWSDRLSSVGIYEFNPSHDDLTQSAQLVAQMVWHFVEGRNGVYFAELQDTDGKPVSVVRKIVVNR